MVSNAWPVAEQNVLQALDAFVLSVAELVI
jgi:hypothetical protein